MATIASRPTVTILIVSWTYTAELSVARDPLNELRGELERLRVEFERYFMGLERRMPAVTRDKLVQRIRRFNPGQDSVLRFRHRNLIQRLMVLEQYWNRILRAMESGTYSRDIARANFRADRKNDAQKPAKPTAERAKKAERKAAEVGAEAAAFLATMGQDKGGELDQSTSTSTKSAPRLKMRGRSKRSNDD